MFALVAVALRLPQVQHIVGEQAAGMLSKKIGAEVRIGRVDVGLFNRLVIDSVVIRDKRGKTMLTAARLAVKIELAPLSEGRVNISSVQMFGTMAKLYKESRTAAPNYQFLIDAFAKKDSTSTRPNLNLRINSLIMRHCGIKYDCLDAGRTPGRINPAHIDVSGISAYIKLKALTADSINAEVRRLAAKERSGLDVKKLAFRITGNGNGCILENFSLALPGSAIAFKRVSATYKTDSAGVVLPTLEYAGDFAAAVYLPDLAFASRKVGQLDDIINMSAAFHGTSTSCNVSKFVLRSAAGGIQADLRGWVSRWQTQPLWHVGLDRLYVSERSLAALAGCFAPDDESLASMAGAFGEIEIAGEVGASENAKLAAIGKLRSSAGAADFHVAMRRDDSFQARLKTDGFDVGHFAKNEKLGSVSAALNASGRLRQGGKPDIKFAGRVSKLAYNGYDFSNITIDGDLRNGRLSGKVDVADPNARLSVSGSLERNARETDLAVTATVERLAPKAAGLSPKWGDAVFGMAVDADFKASKLNDATGSFSLRNFLMVSEADTLGIANATVKSGYDAGEHFVAFDSDFGCGELRGTFEYKTLAQSFVNFIGDKLPTMPGLPKMRKAADNDFTLRLSVNSSEWLEKLFGVPLRLGSPLTLVAAVNDRKRDISLDCTVGNFAYNGKDYRDGNIKVESGTDTLYCDVGITRMQADGGGTDFRLLGSASENKLVTSFEWDNNAAERLSGVFNATSQFFRDEAGRQVAHIDILPSHINIDSTVWSVKPSNIEYSKNNIDIDHFAIVHNTQHITVNGRATDSEADTLAIDLNGVDLGYVLDLADFHSVEFSGTANGRAYVTSPFGKLSARADLRVDHFLFQDGRMGVLNAGVEWNPDKGEIDISAIANDGPDAMTYIDGYVSLKRKYIDLGINAAGTHIDFLESFTGSFLDGVAGQANGELRVVGELKKVNLVGKLAVNGEATVTPTNCKYYLRNDTIAFVPNEIKLLDAPIYDASGNEGIVSGSLYHTYLKNLSYDLHVEADNLLGYNFTDFGEDSFYGTVYATGSVDIAGKSGEVNIDLDVRPEPNSTFVYNVSSPDAIADQNFITWNDASLALSADSLPADVRRAPKPQETPSDIRINFLIDCTPDLTLRLLMDSRTDDYITLNGRGTVRASYFNKGDFNMFGTYSILYGTYGVTIQDIIKKNFVFNEGSSITFGGNPYYASLNLQAVYTVNGVSLSDLNVGNSFTNNTVRVNCIMNINGQPRKPEITFDLDMPTVSSDEKQMIRSIINSEDEMNQQVVYLLGIGRFYPQGSNNSAAQSEEQQSQTSLAMQSLLSGTISTQINNVLNSMFKSNNWNFGANISTGDEGWNNAEYEGLLSGRLLNNRLLINGQFGYRDNAATTNTSSFIGDFDIRYLLKPNGNLSVRVYNQTNDRYFTKSSLNTQGIGLIMKKDFDGFWDLFNIKRKKAKAKE